MALTALKLIVTALKIDVTALRMTLTALKIDVTALRMTLTAQKIDVPALRPFSAVKTPLGHIISVLEWNYSLLCPCNSEVLQVNHISIQSPCRVFMCF